jgi:ectoine hydroxylase-related dioxygenase (phytanoyl-CoA dioxygenase family)
MLSERDVHDFFEYGYLRLRGFVAARDVTEIAQAFARLEALAAQLSTTQEVQGTLFVVNGQPQQPLSIERIVWCGAVEPRLGELGRSAKLLVAMTQLLGTTELDHLINQAHIKRPGDGVGFPYHQDSYHRRYGTNLFRDVNGRGSFVQSLTAIDDMRPENGGLWLIPQSHHLGHVPSDDGSLPNAAVDESKAIPVVLEPGDTLLLSPFTVHGSQPNHSNTPRRLFINGFCCAGANRRQYPGAGTGLRLSVAQIPEAAELLRPLQLTAS